MCTDISRMCCFVSSLRISEIFKQEVKVAEILQYRNRRDTGEYPLSPHPVQGGHQSKFFPSKFGTFLPGESERLPRERNAGQEKHPRHQTNFSHCPQLKLTCEKNHSEKVCTGCGGCWRIRQHKLCSEIRGESLSLETTLH